MTGVLAEGVEDGCLLLRTAGRAYLLLGVESVAGLPSGDQVRVRGVERPGLVTTCQQGVPLEVTEVLSGPSPRGSG